MGSGRHILALTLAGPLAAASVFGMLVDGLAPALVLPLLYGVAVRSGTPGFRALQLLLVSLTGLAGWHSWGTAHVLVPYVGRALAGERAITAACAIATVIVVSEIRSLVTLGQIDRLRAEIARAEHPNPPT